MGRLFIYLFYLFTSNEMARGQQKECIKQKEKKNRISSRASGLNPHPPQATTSKQPPYNNMGESCQEKEKSYLYVGSSACISPYVQIRELHT